MCGNKRFETTHDVSRPFKKLLNKGRPCTRLNSFVCFAARTLFGNYRGAYVLFSNTRPINQSPAFDDSKLAKRNHFIVLFIKTGNTNNSTRVIKIFN